MARVLLIIGLVAITVYAVADWVARSGKWTPGRLNRWVWLAVIIFLPVVGPLAWIITGLVTRAEERQERARPLPEQPTFQAPDDNPTAVADIADRIARRQRRTRPKPKSLSDFADEVTPHDGATGSESEKGGGGSSGRSDEEPNGHEDPPKDAL